MPEPRELIAADLTLKRPLQLEVLEWPPQQVTMMVKDNDEPFLVWLPYLISVVRGGTLSMNLWCRPAPISPDDQTLYSFPFPHVSDGDGWVCYFPHSNGVDEGGCTPKEVAIECMQRFLFGDNKYFICSDAAIPPELTEAMASERDQARAHAAWLRSIYDSWGRTWRWSPNSTGAVTAFFRVWEQLSEAEVLGLTYQSAGRFVDRLAGILRQSNETLRWQLERDLPAWALAQPAIVEHVARAIPTVVDEAASRDATG